MQYPSFIIFHRYFLMICSSKEVVVKALAYWSEGHEFKHQHYKATTTGPLSQALNMECWIRVDLVLWP